MPHIAIERWIGNADDADPGRNLLVLPGMKYPIGMPLLFLPALALREAGWTVWHATWDMTDIAGDDIALREAVNEVAGEMLERVDGHAVFLGKSLGTIAMQTAVRSKVPAVWLTPLLSDGLFTDGGQALLVGGTADPTWDSAAARAMDAAVLEIPDGDHMLYAGDWHRYVRDLETVSEAVVSFIVRVAD